MLFSRVRAWVEVCLGNEQQLPRLISLQKVKFVSSTVKRKTKNNTCNNDDNNNNNDNDSNNNNKQGS